MLCRSTQKCPLYQKYNFFHIMSNLNSVYQQNFYHGREKEMDKLFDEYYLTLFKNIDYPELIQEWKQNIDAAAYEKKLNREIKLP